MSPREEGNMSELVIDGVRIADDTNAFVIAELGHNHAGVAEMLGISHVEGAKRLIQAAHQAGASAVKFQKRDNRMLYTKAFYDAPYQSENAYGTTYGAHREALEFDWAEYCELRDYAVSLPITLFATPFDCSSVDFLEQLGVPCYKVASGSLTNVNLIQYIAQMGKPILLSTGGGTLEDITRAIDVIQAVWCHLKPCYARCEVMALLQCTAVYPCPPALLNLQVIAHFREIYTCVIGLSSHHTAIWDCLAAYVLGARIFEKHFTLKTSARGTDHAFSLVPRQLATLVEDLHALRLALGDGVKRPYPQEQAALEKMGSGLYAARTIPVHHILESVDVVVKSPGGPIPAWKLPEVIGRIIPMELAEDDPIWSSSRAGGVDE